MPPCLTLSLTKVCIKGKVEKFRERSSALPYTGAVVAIEKEAFGSPSTTVPTETFEIINRISNYGWYFFEYFPLKVTVKIDFKTKSIQIAKSDKKTIKAFSLDWIGRYLK